MSSLTCSPSPAGRRVRSTSCRTAERSRCCCWTRCFSRQCPLPQTPPGIYHNIFTQSCHVLLWISLPSSRMPLVTQCCNDSKMKLSANFNLLHIFNLLSDCSMFFDLKVKKREKQKKMWPLSVCCKTCQYVREKLWRRTYFRTFQLSARVWCVQL